MDTSRLHTLDDPDCEGGEGAPLFVGGRLVDFPLDPNTTHVVGLDVVKALAAEGSLADYDLPVRLDRPAGSDAGQGGFVEEKKRA